MFIKVSKLIVVFIDIYIVIIYKMIWIVINGNK